MRLPYPDPSPNPNQVCLQEFLAEELAVRLPCSHAFHEDCVRTWLKKQHTCPTCRNPLPRTLFQPKSFVTSRKRYKSEVYIFICTSPL